MVTGVMPNSSRSRNPPDGPAPTAIAGVASSAGASVTGPVEADAPSGDTVAPVAPRIWSRFDTTESIDTAASPNDRFWAVTVQVVVAFTTIVSGSHDWLSET